MAYYLDENGIYRLPHRAVHRTDEFDPAQLDVYLGMQCRHFWYCGRHRFLLRAVMRECRAREWGTNLLSAVDLGGGCGGWLRYLQLNAPIVFGELALADSSLRALELARSVIGPTVARYHVDLRRLHWCKRWDIAFLLDVLEHIRDDAVVLTEIAESLRPAGSLFVTTPALELFRTYNDAIEHHHRRYRRADFDRLAAQAGLELVYTRYFMFFLSPLLWLSRWYTPDLNRMSAADIFALYKHTHRTPSAPINQLLRWIFSLETPLGLFLPFPWGTSILALLRRPN